MNRHLSLLLFTGLALGQYKTNAVLKLVGKCASHLETSKLTDQN